MTPKARLAALCLLLLPGFCSAQQFRFERKAEKIAKKDPDFAQLDDADEKLVIQAIAAKLREIKDYNRKRRDYKKRLDDVDIKVLVTETDLDALHAKYDKSLKDDQIISQKEEKTELPPKVVTDPPKIEILEIHSDPAYHNLFADNEWAILEGSEDAVDLRQQIDDALKEIGPGGKISGLTIESSASTLKNTVKSLRNPSEWMPHIELSEYRAQTALDFILVYLKSKGVTLDPSQITVDFKGENGDGTSGPADPYGTGAKGNGQPPIALADYAQFRYVDVVIQGTAYITETEQTTVNVPQDPQWDSRLVALDIDVDSKRRWWKFKKHTQLRVRHKHTQPPRKHKLRTWFRNTFKKKLCDAYQ